MLKLLQRSLGGVTAAWLAICILAGCGPAGRGYDVATTAPVPDTTLGPGDTFEITVYDEKELSGRFRVADDGLINFPLLGPVKVAGKSPNMLAHDLEQALRDKQFLRNPNISVYVIDYASKRVAVVGAVSRPGNIPWTSGMSVVQAISIAGGLRALAAANDTIVTRQEGNKPKRYRVPVTEIAEGRVPDFTLLTGDTVYVPERLF